jgi:hypothetical protein
VDGPWSRMGCLRQITGPSAPATRFVFGSQNMIDIYAALTNHGFSVFKGKKRVAFSLPLVHPPPAIAAHEVLVACRKMQKF